MGIDLLKKAAQKNVAKPTSKSKTPTLDLPQTPELLLAIKSWHEAHTKIKTAEADKEMAANILRPVCETLRDTYCEENHFTATIHIKSPEQEQGISFVTMNKYSEIPLDNEEKLTNIFKEEFPNFFEQTTTISLSEKAMKDIDKVLETILRGFAGDELVLTEHELKLNANTISAERKTELEEKIAKLNEEAQNKFFDLMTVKRVFSPTEKFHQERFCNKTTKRKAQAAIATDLIKPYTPSIRPI